MRNLSRALSVFLGAVLALGATSALYALPWIETARLVHAGGAAYDALGASVAIDRDVAVVGQPLRALVGMHVAGAAYVFVRTGGVWTEAATLVPSDGAIDDQFGHAVAISGDTIVVGSPGASSGTSSVLSNEGLAFVFVRPVGGWAGTLTPTAVLYLYTFEGQSQPDRLGGSVAISGDTIVCGAIGNAEDGGGGAVFVYTKPAGGWQAGSSLTPVQALVASDGSGGDELGYSVGVSRDTVIAGAPLASNGPLANAGKAYVWVKPSYGWFGGYSQTESAELFPSGPAQGGKFGFAVAIDGAAAVVTAPRTPYTNSDNEGTRVSYLFEQAPTGWSGTLNESARLVPSAVKISSDPDFGKSISISSDTVVVGTPGLVVFPFSLNDGGAFIFQKPLTGWSADVGEQAKIYRIDDSARNSLFGWSVSISGSTILVGAEYEKVGVNDLQGAAHVFEPGLNPTVTASFIPGSVLTHQVSSMQFLVSNPNPQGFLGDFGFDLTLPSNLFVDGTPNILSSCGPADVEALPGSSAISVSGGTAQAGWTCGSEVNVSSGIPGTYFTATSPVSCDQGCDGSGSNIATLLVRLRQTQTRILVEGPIRVAPGVPVEFPFQVELRPEAALPLSGEVLVSDGAGHACRAEISASGRGACSLTFGNPGPYRVRAENLGNLSFGASTSPPVSVRVGGGG